MSRFLIIPDRNHLAESLSLSARYNLGFEFNDFFLPDVLDDSALCLSFIRQYKEAGLPSLCTCHGDFFDVLVFSQDARIRHISETRILQSLRIAEQIGASSVIFHTNHNPMLKAENYIQNWLSKNEDFWSRILEEYPHLNIYLENMFDDSPQMLRMLSERLCRFANYGVCYDYAHAALSGVPNEIWSSTLAPYIRHIHINDNDLTSDLHLAVGDGKINWDHFILERNRYFPDATVLIETTSLENQRHSIDFLSSKGLL